MSDPIENAPEPEKAPGTPAKPEPTETAKVFFLWIALAGLWQTGEVAWTILRALARLIA